MKKISIYLATIICLTFICTNANAQLLKKLKEKVNAAASGTTNNGEGKKADETAGEEKISKVGKTFTIKGKDGNKNYDIADNAEMILEEKVSNGTMQYYFTNGKKQYTSNIVTIDKDNNVLEIKKFFINKDQIENCMQSYKSSDNSIRIKFFTKSTPIGIRQSQDGYEGTATSEGTFDLYTNTAKKANELQSLVLGAAMNGDVLNTFAYVTGDGKVIKTSVKPLWELQGALYLEVLEKEKAYRVTYFEDNNTDTRHGHLGYLTKVTMVPFESIGAYNAVELGSTEVYLPLKKPVTKTIWVNSDNPTTEVITDKLKAVANNFNSTLTNEYCNIIVKAFPANVQAKFKNEIQAPRVAALAKQEAEAAEAARIARLEREQAGNESSSSASSTKAPKAKKDVSVKLSNERRNGKVELVFKSPSRATNTSLTHSTRATYRIPIGAVIYVDGAPVLTITAAMDDTTQVIAR